MENRNYGLDALRSIAILSVLFLHTGDSIQGLPSLYLKMAKYGWSGVDIFFVLSGFLIASQVFHEKSQLGTFQLLKIFWTKRWFRTLPLYFVVLFVYMVLKPLAGFPFADQNILPYFFFLQNYFFPTDFVQSWSLCIEEQFYLVFPLLAYLLGGKKWPAYFWLLPIILCIISRTLTYQHYQIVDEPELSSHIRFITHNYIDAIAMGVLLAKLKPIWTKYPSKYALPLALNGSLFFILSLGWMGTSPKIGLSGYLSATSLGLSASIMLIGFYKLRVPAILIKPAYWTSITSYGLYLWNPLTMRLFEKYITQFHWSVDLLLFLIINFVIAFLSYKLVESPFMKLRNKYLKAIK